MRAVFVSSRSSFSITRSPSRPPSAMSTASTPLPFGETFFLDSFANRQWVDVKHGTFLTIDKADFVQRVEEAYKGGAKLIDGYAPFCKHIFLPTSLFPGLSVKVGNLKITEQNCKHLRSGYSKRRPEELAVLTRWFPEELVRPVPEARYVDIILYSRDQLLLEYAALPAEDKRPLPDAPWGIISIKAQDEDFETPMAPITMLRNSLGREEGGSGVALDRAKYEASVAYWSEHASVLAIRDGEMPKGD